MKKCVSIILAVFLMFSLSACLVPTTSRRRAVSSTSTTSKASSSKAEKTEFDVGERAELNGIVITMTSVTESTGVDFYTPGEGKVYVICEFEVENNSNQDLSVSSIMSFNAFVDDYAESTNLSAILASGKDQIDGTAAPGKKVSGVLAYEVDADWGEIEIRFTPDVWDEKSIVFVHHHE